MSIPEALTSGTKIGSFEIKATLGISNHGVIYRARDRNRKRDVAIQEYLPSEFAQRSSDDVSVEARDDKQSVYEEGLTRFLQEARLLAQIHDPYIARIIEYTETNGTAYLVIEYEAGRTLSHYLQKKTRLEEDGLQKILIPMLKGLRVIHSAGVLHCDIRPNNIFLRKDGPPVLIGFGSAVRALVHEPGSLDCRVTPGYSPIEQYHDGGNLGPWTDLYSLGATLYHCIAGLPPVDATRRLAAIAQGEEDPLVPAIEIGRGDYGTHLLGSIDWMLQPVITDRPDSAGAVLGLLSERPAPNIPTEVSTESPRGLRLTPKPDPDSPYRLPYQSLRQSKLSQSFINRFSAQARKPSGWAIAALMLAGLIGLALWQNYRDIHRSTEISSSETATFTDGSATNTIFKQTPASSGTKPLEEYIKPDQKVNFSREDDDLRATRYRELEQDQKKVAQLQASAIDHIETDQLTFPPENNALSDFRAILDIDAGNVDAKQGINDIAAKLVIKARESFNRREIMQAEVQLEEVEYIQTGREDVIALRQEIGAYKKRLEENKLLVESQRQRGIAARNQRIAGLLKQAEQTMTEEHLTSPADNNALTYYLEVLQLDSNNAAAQAGIKEIGRRYLDIAGQAIVDADFDRSETYLAAATAVQADRDTINLLRKQALARQKALEQEKQRLKIDARLNEQRLLEEKTKRSRKNTNLALGIQAYYRSEYIEAFQLLKPIAEAGDARAQFRLGIMYHLGRGTARDPGLAQSWVRKALPTVQDAATSGEAWAQADLGSLYEDGLVVAKNDAEAVRWYHLAASQGYAGAQTNLGVMYANGSGVARNVDEAIRWLRLAAAQGDKIAQENLATLGVR